MTDKKTKPLFYYDPVLMVNFWFFINWPPDKCEKFCRKHWNFDDIGFEGRAGRCIEFDNGKGKHAIAVWTRFPPRGAQHLGTIAHECVHAANMAMSSRKIKLDFDNDEYQAYLTGHLVRVSLGMKARLDGGFSA